MKCVSCQNELTGVERFCRFCGAPVQNTAMNPAAPVAPQAPVTPVAPAAPVNQGQAVWPANYMPKTVAVRHADFDEPSEPAPAPAPAAPAAPAAPMQKAPGEKAASDELPEGAYWVDPPKQPDNVAKSDHDAEINARKRFAIKEMFQG